MLIQRHHTGSLVAPQAFSLVGEPWTPPHGPPRRSCLCIAPGGKWNWC